MKINARYFKAVAADMKLEQSIHRSKKAMEELEAKKASRICQCVGINIPRRPGYQQRLWRNLEIRFGKYRCKSFALKIEE